VISTNVDKSQPLPQPQNSSAQVDEPGTIEINVTNRHTPRGGSQDVDDSAATEQVLSKVARNEFQLKRYDSAANAYEKLLKNGGDAASINQRLGQCYEHLGKKEDAVSAYKRAASVLKANMGSGRGNSAGQKAALDTVQTAIKVLGGE